MDIQRNSFVLTFLFLATAAYQQNAARSTVGNNLPKPEGGGIDAAPSNVCTDKEKAAVDRLVEQFKPEKVICDALARPSPPHNRECAGFDVRRLIAIVPDPVETHLSLFFDRIVESLQWAVGDAGYTFLTYRFPWKNPPSTSDPDPAKRQWNRLEKQALKELPGILVFRGKDDNSALVVFLVLESPTLGINRMQFRAAADWGGLRGLNPRLRIVGPTFSGSIDGLQDELKRAGMKADVVSGSVTDDHEIKKFVSDQGSFRTTLAPDRYPLDYFSNLGSGTAILSEDETAYGARFGQSLGSPNSPLLIRFPREISRLRNASKDASGSVDNASKGERKGLTFKLQDSQPGEDSVPSFSSSQTPLSQEAVLLNIASTLKRDRVSKAAIIGTDILDLIFIANFLRVSCPEVRLYTFDSDLLMPRAADEYPFTGMLSISTYPLFAMNQHWTSSYGKEYPPRHAIFSSQSAEGTYNAAIALLRSGTDPLMIEYSRPDRWTPVPPLWLSVVSQSGYWPVRLLSETTPDKRMQVFNSETKLIGFRPDPGQPSRAWATLVVLLSVVGLIQAVAILLFPRLKVRHLKLYHLEADVPQFRAPYLLWATLALSTSLFLALAPAWILMPQRPGIIGFGLIVCIGLIVAALQASCRTTWNRNSAESWLAAAAWVTFISVSVTWISMLWPAYDLSGEFVAYRSLQLTNGVAPLAPVLILLGAVYVWALTSVQRLRLFDERKPTIPTSELDKTGVCPRTTELFEKLNVAVHRVIYVGGLPWQVTLASYICLIVLLRPDRYFDTFENSRFHFLCCTLMALAYALMLLEWGRFIYIWQHLRDLLSRIEGVPLRPAFLALPKEYSRSPLIEGRVLNRSHVIYAQAVARLQQLSTCRVRHWRDQFVMDKTLAQLQAMLRAFLKDPTTEIAPVQEAFAGASQLIMETILGPIWSAGALETDPQDKFVVIATEFIALRVLLYIRYVFLQMRNLLMFVTLCFVFLMLTLAVYPFRGHQTLLYILTVTFIVIGAGLIWVFAQVSRNATISSITKTEAGKLDGAFLERLVLSGALPVITILASQFPALSRFLFSWVKPALDALH